MSRLLYLQAESLLLNPTLDAAMIAADIEADPESARAEWLGEFRSDISQFLGDDLIDAAMQPGVRALARVPGTHYVGFSDPSGARHDSFSLAIAHQERGGRVVLDKLIGTVPPFEPEAVVEKYCETLSAYGLQEVTGDKYAGEWVSSMFRKYGITYLSATQDKSAIYVETLPLFTQKLVNLVDVPQLDTQLRLLERRPRSGGRGDFIDHPPRCFDDLANSACGALWLASKQPTRALGDSYDELGELVGYQGRRTKLKDYDVWRGSTT